MNATHDCMGVDLAPVDFQSVHEFSKEDKAPEYDEVELEMSGTDTVKNKEADKAADFETAIAETGFGKFNVLLMLAVLPCMLANDFDSGTISYIIPFAQCDLQLTSFNKGALNAITYGGMICSAFLWGFLSDTLGRKKIFVTGHLIHGCIGIVSSFSQSFIMMMVLRFFSGFMGSGPFVVVMSYVSEVYGSKYRSRALIIMGIFLSVSSVCLPGIAWGIIPQTWSLDLFNGYKYSSWNLFVAVCGLPSILAGILLSFFDESPKFLMAQGRNAEALKVFQRIYSINTGKTHDTYPVKFLLEENKQMSEEDPRKSIREVMKLGWEQVIPLFKYPYALHALHVFAIQIFCYFGMITLRLWIPQFYSIMEDFNNIYEKENVSLEASTLCDVLTFSNKLQNFTNNGDNGPEFLVDTNVSCSVNINKSDLYSNSMITGAVNIIFLCCASYLINIAGKKKLMTGGFTIALVCGIVLQWAISFPVLVSSMSIFMSMNYMCAFCLVSLVVELFPTTLRAMAVSLTMMFGRLAALTGNLLFAVLFDWKCVAPFYFIAAAMLAAAILSFFISDTKGKFI